MTDDEKKEIILKIIEGIDKGNEITLKSIESFIKSNSYDEMEALVLKIMKEKDEDKGDENILKRIETFIRSYDRLENKNPVLEIIEERERVKKWEQYKRDENALKRIKTFVKSYDDLVRAKKFDGNKFKINASFATNAINLYLDDLAAMKKRYKISDRVQSPKIAGLMANAILKFRPIVPVNGREENIGDVNVNEIVAIYHGFIVCAADGKEREEKIREIMHKPFYSEWFEYMRFILRGRNYTAESLYMIFQTLRLAE
jgi:hypothetical protein